MTKISARSTPIVNWVFPLVWYGFLAYFVISTLTDEGEPSLFLLLVLLAMGIAGFIAIKRSIWELVDEVYDGGDFLLIRNRGNEDKVRLGDIMNVTVPLRANPPRLILRLKKPSQFDEETAFTPRSGFSYNPSAENSAAENLIVRFYRART